MPKAKKFKMGPKQRKWLSALKSGKFIQTRGTLGRKTRDGKLKHCCLGVLCELNIKAIKEVGWDEYTPTVKTYDDSDGNLPSHMKDLAGLYDVAGGFDGKSLLPPERRQEFDKLVKQLDSLAEVNDTSRSYDKVIEIISKFPEAVFIRSA
jgi:hypothetical protein